ncbi:MAG TPA: hypothetical protein VNQ90_06770 [Chthoniobacteraceae bacterium]|nr:hypothetical protein [Chthoniobacteraceae bacterium]
MNQILQQLSTPEPQEPEAETETVEPEPEETPVAPEEPPVEPEPEAVSEESSEEAGERRARNFRGRWDHLNDEERRVVELTTKRGLSLKEAYRAVYGVEEGAAPEAARTPHPPTVEAPAVLELDREIAEQQSRLEALREEKTQAKGDLALYDQAAEAYFDAREGLRELERRRETALEQARAAQQATRQEAERVALAALEAEFPEALTPGSELYEACREELAYLQESGNPLSRDPGVAYKVARRLARTLGYPRRTEAAPAPAVRTARPVPTGGAPLEVPVMAVERRVAEARSPDAMLHLMRELGTPFEALLQK